MPTTKQTAAGPDEAVAAGMTAVDAAEAAVRALDSEGRRLIGARYEAVMAGDGDAAVVAQRQLDELPLRRLVVEVAVSMAQAGLCEVMAAALDDEVATTTAERVAAEERWRQVRASGEATRADQQAVDAVRLVATAAYTRQRDLRRQQSTALAAVKALMGRYFADGAAPIVRSLPHARSY